MKIAVLGRGFLGKEFERQGFDVFGKEMKFNVMLNMINGYDAVVNCIGKTNTRWCEDRRNINGAMYSNFTIPGLLSMRCANNKIKFVHISTGCLYDTPYCSETDPLVAHCTYTMSKWAGETQLSESDIVLRPRLLYSDVPDRNNFLCKLPKYERYVDNAEDSFTYTADIPKAVTTLLEDDQYGAFNICSNGSGSVFDVADALSLDPLPTTIEKVRKEQGLHLVNCTMDTHKLRQHCSLSSLWPSMKSCFDRLQQGVGE